MTPLADRKLSSVVMLDQIEQLLRRGVPAGPAYTLVLGAGASFGSVPTAKEMLGIPEGGLIHPKCIPVFLKELESGVADRTLHTEIGRNFWARFVELNPDLAREQIINGMPKIPVLLQDGFPTPSSISEAYKSIFDQRRTGGINTPASARDYLKSITMRKSEHIRLNGTHFFLASLLSLQRYADDEEARQKGLFVGKRPFARTIFTTNFDPLLQVSLQLFQLLYYMTDRPDLLAADALQTDDHPALHLFYAHGSVHRPFVANTDSEITFLRDRNARDLSAYLGQHGVIVLGYSGWDDCLLRALNQTNSFANNLYWLARGKESLSPQVQAFLLSHPNAYWVEISDGGQFMAELHCRLCPSLQFTELLQNPIPFLRRRLERVVLSSAPPTTNSIPTTGIDAASASDRPTSPEEFRKQVVELLLESADQFEKLSNTGGVQAQLKRLEHQGDLAYSKGNWAKTFTLFGKIASKKSVSQELLAKALNRQAYSLIKRNRGKEGRKYLTRITLLPNITPDLLAETLLMRGLYFMVDGSQKEAVADFSKSLETAGVAAETEILARYHRGDAYFALDRINDAISDYSAVIDNPESKVGNIGTALLERAACYQTSDKFDNALTDWSTLIDLQGAPPEIVGLALVRRAEYYEKVGKRSDALADFTRAIELSGIRSETLALALNFRGYIHAQNNNDAFAIADYTRTIELREAAGSQLAYALAHMGVIYEKQGEIELALSHYKKAIGTKGAAIVDVARARCNRAMLLQKRGDIQAAELEFRAILDSKDPPDDARAAAELFFAEKPATDTSRRDLDLTEGQTKESQGKKADAPDNQ